MWVPIQTLELTVGVGWQMRRHWGLCEQNVVEKDSLCTYPQHPNSAQYLSTWIPACCPWDLTKCLTFTAWVSWATFLGGWLLALSTFSLVCALHLSWDSLQQHRLRTHTLASFSLPPRLHQDLCWLLCCPEMQGLRPSDREGASHLSGSTQPLWMWPPKFLSSITLPVTAESVSLLKSITAGWMVRTLYLLIGWPLSAECQPSNLKLYGTHLNL